MSNKEFVIEKYPNAKIIDGIMGNSKTHRNVLFVIYRKDNISKEPVNLSWGKTEEKAWGKAAKKIQRKP